MEFLVHKACLFHVLQICFSWSRRFFVFLICCILLFVLWVRTFFPSKFSLVPGFFGLVTFSVHALPVFMLLPFWCFFGFGLFLLNFLRHLGCFFFTVLFSCRFFQFFLGCFFSPLFLLHFLIWTCFGVVSALGPAYFGPSLIIGVFGQNTRCPPEGGVFCYLVSCRRCISGVKLNIISMSCPKNATKTRVSERERWGSSDPPLFTFYFC